MISVSTILQILGGSLGVMHSKATKVQ